MQERPLRVFDGRIRDELLVCEQFNTLIEERSLLRHFDRLELRTRPDGQAPQVFGRFELRLACATTENPGLCPARLADCE